MLELVQLTLTLQHAPDYEVCDEEPFEKTWKVMIMVGNMFLPTLFQPVWGKSKKQIENGKGRATA